MNWNDIKAFVSQTRIVTVNAQEFKDSVRDLRKAIAPVEGAPRGIKTLQEMTQDEREAMLNLAAFLKRWHVAVKDTKTWWTVDGKQDFIDDLALSKQMRFVITECELIGTMRVDFYGEYPKE
jgi:hypothetical protein